MKFLTCEKDSKKVAAVLNGDRIVPLNAIGFDCASLEDFICSGVRPDEVSARLKGFDGGYSFDEVRLLAAIPEPTQEIIIMENNYLRDAAEIADFAARRDAEGLLPTYYYKKVSLANNDGGEIPSYPGYVESLDYQAELCAVLGRDAFRVSPDKVGDYIFGYTVINNVIAHNITVRHRRPYISTGLDGFAPMCSYIVTADEFEAGHEFTVRSFVNGELRQNATTALLRFDANYAVSDLTISSVLRAGSILSLGAPFGRGCDMTPPVWLKSGDRVVCEAVGVGSVSNTVK